MSEPIVRPTIAFALVSSRGWPLPSSSRGYAYEVRQWADENWGDVGGYAAAKKEGWRVRKVKMIPAEEPPL